MSTSLDASERKKSLTEIDSTLGKLIATTQEVIAVLNSDEFDPNCLDRLQGIRSKLYVYLQQSSDAQIEPTFNPLAGHPLVAELLELEKQAFLLASTQREKASGQLKATKQQRQVTRAYAGQTNAAGQLFDKKEF